VEGIAGFDFHWRPAERILSSYMEIVRLLYIFGGLVFLASAAAHLYVRVRLRPREDSGLDDYYHEFEDQHPEYARYTRWLRITLGGAALGVALLFLVYIL
jgi:hypothetical protein